MLCLKVAFKSCMIAGIWLKRDADFSAQLLCQGQMRSSHEPTLRSLWVWSNECAEPGDQGPHRIQVTCRLSLCLKPQFCQVKSTELHVLIGEGNGTPLQYSCLENPMDRGAWWAAVHGVTQSRTRLKRLSSSSSSIVICMSFSFKFISINHCHSTFDL